MSADIWPLETVTGALSELAEATLRLAIRHLLRTAHDAGEIRLQDTKRPDLNCGFVALAMGKLGAAELNYSSDIDLILVVRRHGRRFTRAGERPAASARSRRGWRAT